jgi:hypothetical protein
MNKTAENTTLIDVIKACGGTAQPGTLKEALTDYLPQFARRIKAEKDLSKRAVMRIKYKEMLELRDSL